LHPGPAEVVVRVATFAAATLLAAGSAFAQTPEPVAPLPQTPTFRSGAALVSLNVTVQNGPKYVTGLQPADFAVYEDGVKQDVRFFEADAVPVDLIVLIDTSASMIDKLDVVHEAAAGFVKTLRATDRGAVVTFSDNVSVAQPLTSDVAQLDKAIRATGAHGSTSLYNAVYVALKQFGRGAKDSSEVRRQAIVVLSDGEDTSSLISFDDVMGLARRMGVNIYTVGLQSPDAIARQQLSTGHRYFSEADYSMKTLASETGATSFFPGPADLRGVYASIATELASQYSIGYVPANGHPDGRFRRVVVQVISHPELRPRTRQGYTADSPAVARAGSSSRQ
jgi:Ca-activated chloride channel family protein